MTEYDVPPRNHEVVSRYIKCDFQSGSIKDLDVFALNNSVCENVLQLLRQFSSVEG